MKSNKPKSNRTKSDAALAEQWQCDERTVRRWRGKHAPVDDPAAMVTWLAAQRSIPQRTLALVMAEQRKRRAEVADTALALPPGTPGTPNALKRLEDSEERAYRAVIAAEQSGNPIEIKIATQRWVAFSRELLRYDLAVQESRRGTELIPRESVEQMLETIGRALATDLRGEFHKIPATLHGAPVEAIARTLDTTVRACVRSALGYYVGTRSEVPAWATDSLTAGFEEMDGTGRAWTTEQIDSIRALTGYLTTLTKAQIESEATGAAAAIRWGSVRDRQEFLEWQQARRREERRGYLGRCVELGLPASGLSEVEEKEFPGLEKLDWQNPKHREAMEHYNEKSFNERKAKANL